MSSTKIETTTTTASLCAAPAEFNQFSLTPPSQNNIQPSDLSLSFAPDSQAKITIPTSTINMHFDVCVDVQTQTATLIGIKYQTPNFDKIWFSNNKKQRVYSLLIKGKLKIQSNPNEEILRENVETSGLYEALLGDPSKLSPENPKIENNS